MIIKAEEVEGETTTSNKTSKGSPDLPKGGEVEGLLIVGGDVDILKTHTMRTTRQMAARVPWGGYAWSVRREGRIRL